MGLPVIAIVGRPNVGKSSLFNAISGRRTSIVESTPGVTRDRVTTVCDLNEIYFELVDTGGYGIEDIDDLTDHVERQIFYAIEQADLILFVVDIRDGIVPLDQKMADLLRTRHDRVWLIANKTDDVRMAPEGAEFLRLGYGEPRCVSASHRNGIRELIEHLTDRIKGDDHAAPEEPVMKFAIVGKRNTGKSTFINSLAGEDRVIVSEVAGTTRDAIDVRFEKDGRVFVAIDTAGVRKKSKLADSIEFYALTRAQLSIERADVTLLLMDSTQTTSHVEKKLAAHLVEACKPVVIVVNKWDLAKSRTSTEEYGEYLTKTLPNLDYAPVAFVSAIDDRNVTSAVDVASSLFKQYNHRVGTGELNQVLASVMAERGPSVKRGTRLPRIYYATQVATNPPTIVLFVNDASSFRQDYLRFLVNRFRSLLPFEEIPIRLVLRARRSTDRTPSAR